MQYRYHTGKCSTLPCKRARKAARVRNHEPVSTADTHVQHGAFCGSVSRGGAQLGARADGVDGARGSRHRYRIDHAEALSPSSMAPRVGGARHSSRMAAGRLAGSRTGWVTAQGLDQGSHYGPRLLRFDLRLDGRTHVMRVRLCVRPSNRRSKRSKAAASARSLSKSGAPHREAGREVPVRSVNAATRCTSPCAQGRAFRSRSGCMLLCVC